MLGPSSIFSVWVILLLVVVSASGQPGSYQIKGNTFVIKSPDTLKNYKRVFKGKVLPSGSSFALEQISSSLIDTSENRILSVDAKIDGRDLLVNYKLEKSIFEEYYNLQLNLYLDDQKLDLRNNRYLGEIQGVTDQRQPSLKWYDVQDQILDHINPKPDMTVELVAQFYGYTSQFKANCFTEDQLGLKVRPSFELGLKDQPWHYVGFGLGVVGIGLGQILDKVADDRYEEYRNTLLEEDAIPIYEDANRKHQDYLLATYTGIGIIGLNIIVAYFRRKAVIKDQKAFDNNCLQAFGINESIQIGYVPFQINHNTFAGKIPSYGNIQFLYTF